MSDTPDIYAQPPAHPAAQGSGDSLDIYAPPQHKKQQAPQQASSGGGGSMFGTPGAGAHSQQATTLDATATKHSLLQEVFGTMGMFQSIGDAMTEGRLSGKGEFSKIPELMRTDPAVAMDKYGLNSKEFLQYVVAHTPPSDYEHKWAQWNLANPRGSGWETFFENFLPGMNVGGGPVGKLGEKLHGWLSSFEKGRQFLNVFSPLRNIAKVAGDTGKHAIQRMMTHNKIGDDVAMREVDRIYGGLGVEENQDVVRRFQGGKYVPKAEGEPMLGDGLPRLPRTPGKEIPVGDPMEEDAWNNPNYVFVPGPGKVKSLNGLDARAHALNDLMRRTTATRVAEGTLPKSSVYNQQRFYYMRGAYKDPRLNEDEFDFIESLRKGDKGASGGAFKLPENYKKTFTNIDEALASGLLRPDFSAPDQLYKYLSRSNQNLSTNADLWNLPGTLIRHPDQEMFNRNPLHAEAVPDIHEVRGGKAFQPEAAASGRMLEPGKAMRPPGSALAVKNTLPHKADLPANPEEDIYRAFYEQRPGLKNFDEEAPPGWVRAEKAFPGTNLLPAMRGAWLKREFADWLAKSGGSMLTGRPVKLFNSEGLAEWVERYNSFSRQAIVANPMYHLLWNIAWNGSTAMEAGPIGLVGNTARALLGALKATPKFAGGDYIRNLALKIGDSGVYQRFMGSTRQWNEDVMDAMRDAATAEFGATHSIFGGKAADLLTQPLWSKDLSFAGKMDQLFTKATDWNKRAVFGPHGEQVFATRLYRRLRDRGYDDGTAAEMTREALGNYQNVDPNNPMAQLIFFYPWLKSNTAFWTKAFLTKPAYSAAPLEGIRRNNQIAGDPNMAGVYPTPDYTIYRRDANGESQYLTPPIPQRTAAGIINAIGTGDPREMLFEGANIAASHANPVVGEGIRALNTLAEQKRGGIDPSVGSNYDVMFDTDAPTGEKLAEISRDFASHIVPMPLFSYAVQDALRTGWSPKKIGDEIVQSAGLGFPHNRATLAESKQINKARNIFEKTVYSTNNLLYPKTGKPTITKQQAAARIARAYALYAKRRDAVMQAGQKPQTPPTGGGSMFGPTPKP